jgi:vacuolar-type H+-ATPase subunit F/Vma7
MSPGTPPQELVAIGAPALIAGFALAGVRLYPATDAAQVRAAWATAPVRDAVVVLTPDAADALGADRTAPSAPLTVVMPR